MSFVAGVDLGSSASRRSTAVAILSSPNRGRPRLIQVPAKFSRDRGVEESLSGYQGVRFVAIDCPLNRDPRGEALRSSEKCWRLGGSAYSRRVPAPTRTGFPWALP